jgi:hypothetical protein
MDRDNATMEREGIYGETRVWGFVLGRKALAWSRAAAEPEKIYKGGRPNKTTLVLKIFAKK